MDIEALAAGCLFDRQVLVLSRPASRRARPMRGMHGIHEQHRLIGAQGVHQFLVKLDERALLGLVEMARNDFGLAIFEAETMQKRDQSRAAFVFHPEFRCDPRAERAEPARTHPTSFPRCASLRTQALPPASNRISALRPPSANAPCQRRIVSSSSKRTRATCSQLRPSSSNTSALARRANRCVTDPSRASAISAERSPPNKKPGRIIPSNESNSTRLARAFRIPNESGYIIRFLFRKTNLLRFFSARSLILLEFSEPLRVVLTWGASG